MTHPQIDRTPARWRAAAPVLARLALTCALGVAAGCTTSTSYIADRCDIGLGALSPAEAAPGASVVVTAGPLTRSWDTTVLLGGVSAQVVDLERSGCDSCDLCRNQADCNACDDCDDCDALCAVECVESLTFVVPELPAGSYSLQLVNGHGSSAGLSFTVLAPLPADTGAPDTGAPDTGAPDTGAPDTGAPPAPPTCR